MRSSSSDPLARTLSLPPGRAGGGESPAITGRVGMGGVKGSANTGRCFKPVPRAYPPTSPPRRGSGDLWGDCGMGGAARAAIVVSQPWRARPASQRKRRLKRRARAFPGASLESARHPSVALARPCKRHRRGAIHSDQDVPG